MVSKFGPIELEVPRDRQAEFEPQVVPKRQRDISGLEDKIISMYAKGMTIRDIQSHIEDIYGYRMSPETISMMTDRVIDKAREWQDRALESLYVIVYMDALFLKMRRDGQVKNVAVYSIIGINLDGYRECLGIWICETESSRYWLGVLNELRNRGVKDVLIFSIDGLPGLPDAIKAAFPKSETQLCIVHQLRNSLKHVSWKVRKPMAESLKQIYTAPTEQTALKALDEFEERWKDQYAYVGVQWRKNWDQLAPFFKYSPELKRLIYTTNPIERVNRSLKKVCRPRIIFPTEESLVKMLYLAILDISKKWNTRIRDWSEIYAQLNIFFADRIN